MPTVIDLSALGSHGFIVQGDAPFDLAGWSVSSAGDVNGDGFDDFIVGAHGGDNGGTSAGQAYVIFGKAGGLANIDLSSLAPPDGFVIQGDAAGDFAGFDVSSAGDVNGDGFDDIIIGARNAGDAYVIFGKASGFANIDLSSLALADGFILQGPATGDFIVDSVSSAGDVNGDGYDDVIIGSASAGADFSGRAYVIFGKASGFTNIDLSSLAPPDGYIIQGDVPSDFAGGSVAGAGDVNGDGFDDIIVGASGGDDGGYNAGEAYIIFGKASGFGLLFLNSLALNTGFIIQGGAPNDRVGLSVSRAGDINGDGFVDLIVGGSKFGGPDTGTAYVIFGKATGFTNVGLSGWGPPDGFIAVGDPGDRAFRVSPAGDVNGDGFDDFIVGAYRGDDGGNGAGEAYVIFGKAGGFANFNLSALAAEDGFIIQGDAAFDGAGHSVDGAGDVNGDGFDDVIVGKFGSSDGGTDGGEAYVVYGFGPGDFPLAFDLAEDINPASGATIVGDTAGDLAGFSVSPAGDVNGDGYDDFVIGAPAADNVGGASSGEAYVLFGGADGIPDVDLSALSLTDGFRISGAVGDAAGDSVASAGDFNGDGFDDLIVGAPFDGYGALGGGGAYIVLGKATGFTHLSLFGFTPPPDWIRITGDDLPGREGSSVAAGDINGDGYDDAIIGAWDNDSGGTDTGRAYVVFGRSANPGTIDLGSLLFTSGFAISGAAPGDRAGFSVDSAGDVNNDGFDDFIIGAPLGDAGGNEAGQAYLIFGKASWIGGLALSALNAADGFTIRGQAAGDQAGWSVASAGDFNGDDYDDLVVGARLGNGDDAGKAYVIFGKSGGFTDIDLNAPGPSYGFAIQGDSADDRAGISVASAGDVNGDGYDDLVVGAYRGDNGANAGEAYVIFGKASGFADIDLTSLAATDGFIIKGDAAGDGAGYSAAAAGDLNGDGFDDLVVGALYGDDGGNDAGQAYVIYGRAPTKAVTRTGAAADQDIRGGAFDDTLIGLGGDDNLFGSDGNDTLIGWTGADLLHGGGGTDTANYGNDGGAVTVNLASGLGSGNSAQGDTYVSVENVTGSAFADTIVGNGGANLLIGGGGADLLDGGGGIDTTSYANDAGAVTVNLASGLGSGNSAQGDTYFGIENATGSNFADTIIGNGGANLLIGGGGNDTLIGGAGADTSNGGLGDDTHVVDIAGDVVVEGVGQGNDLVVTGVNFVLGANWAVERLVTSNAASTVALNLAGNGYANNIQGNAGANVLLGHGSNDILLGFDGDDIINGGAGNDNMNGGLGNDIYFIDSVSDVIVEVDGQGTNDRLFATYILRETEFVEQVLAATQAATNAMNLTGNSRTNILQGNNGNNILDGKGGNNSLLGFGGVDTFVFSTALNATTNVDTIVGFVAAADKILLGGLASQPFFALPAGTLSASAFVIGSAATTAGHRIVYNSDTGGLFFDADGSGAGAKVQFAILSPGLALTNANFIVADPLAYAASQPQGGAAPAADGKEVFDQLGAGMFGDDAAMAGDMVMLRHPMPMAGDAPVAFA